LFLWFDETKQRQCCSADKAASARERLIYTKKEGVHFAEEKARFVENGPSGQLINK